MVRLPAATLRRYPRVSLYNSPYVAHDRGCAVDLYPDAGDAAPSPVAGTIVDTRTVRAPPKPYAPEHDHLVVVDVEEAASGLKTDVDDPDDVLARILHVEPSVEAGDEVAVGDSLGSLVRAGFFAPWVANHLHVGFRPVEADPVRASGSLPLSLGTEVRPVPWDGTGTVVETADTYAVLDAPDHPAPGECYAGIAAGLGAGLDDDDVVAVGGGDPGREGGRAQAALDGGLPHYDGGGVFGVEGEPGGSDRPVSLLGTRVGVADGRDVAWDGVEVRANGTPVTGLSLFLGLEELYAKLVCPDVSFAVGEPVTVRLDRG